MTLATKSGTLERMPTFKLRPLTGLLVPLLCFSLCHGNGATLPPTCEKALQASSPKAFYEMVQVTESAGEVFLEHFRKGLGRRYAHHPEVTALTQEMAAAPIAVDPVRFTVDWEGNTATIRKAFEDHRLRYTLETIYIKVDDGTLATGARPKSINSAFAKTLTALTEAMRLDILKHPDLKNVELRMGVVMNLDLFHLLKKLGFRVLTNLQFNQEITRAPPSSPFQRGPHGLGGRMDNHLSLTMGFEHPLPIQTNPNLGRTLVLNFSVLR